jgi:hypothetical protein
LKQQSRFTITLRLALFYGKLLVISCRTQVGISYLLPSQFHIFNYLKRLFERFQYLQHSPNSELISTQQVKRNQDFPDAIFQHPQKTKLAQQRVSLGCFANGRPLL